MKTTTAIAIVCLLVAAGCSREKKLTLDNAREVIEKEYKLPREAYYSIYCGDPVQARKMIDKGLEGEGLVRVRRKSTFNEMDSPLIRFTDKAAPYLMPVTSEERSNKIQKVKIANESLGELQIGEENPQGIPVSFTIVRRNLTPFAPLVEDKAPSGRKHTVYFTRAATGWILEKRY